jgi:D-arabinose 1-dehydrogenase-like Zn-dependent alcohol dehydrogenase
MPVFATATCTTLGQSEEKEEFPMIPGHEIAGRVIKTGKM